ncbi:hypothetical protein L7F22_014420 [Adiantum nelumboides]|nr:hypothetical protein [Adiantum nelumboides]
MEMELPFVSALSKEREKKPRPVERKPPATGPGWIKEKMPLSSILQALSNAPPSRDFIEALQKRAAETDVPALIAEVKKASPSKGVIQPNFDPGDFEYLKRVRNAGIECPLLCKDFIIDAWQLYFARLHGADAVLLIAAVLPDQDLRYISKICKKLGLVALVEVREGTQFMKEIFWWSESRGSLLDRTLHSFKMQKLKQCWWVSHW